MKRKIIILFSVIFFGTMVSFAAIGSKCPPLTIFSDITDSGIKTYVVQIPRSPVVSVKLFFRGGAFGENDQRGSGLAHAVQSIIYDNINKRFIDSGIPFTKLSSQTHYDSISFSANSVKDNLPIVIKKIAEEISNTKFSEKIWSRKRENLINQILFEKNNPWKQLDILFRKTAFMWDPVQFSIDGNISLLNNLSHDDLTSFYKKYFVADNLVIVIAGDVNPENVSLLVKKAFADIPHTTGVLPKKFENPVQTAPRWFEQHGNVTQCYVSVGFSTASAGHPDIAALHLLSEIIEKDKIEKLLKENTLTFSDLKISLLTLPGNPEEFIISFSCDENSAARAAGSLETYITNLSSHVWSERIIEQQQQQFLIDYLKSMNSTDFISEFVGKSALRLGNPHYPEINTKNLLEITPRKLTAVCKKYFVPERFSVAVLSPEQSSDEILGLPKEQLLRGERALLGKTHIPIQRIVLDNGVKILLRKVPDSPLVNISFAGIGGLWCENENNNGVFSIIAEVMQSLKYEKPKKFFFQRKEKNDEINIFPTAKSNFQTFTLSASAIPQLADETVKRLCRVWVSPELNEKNISSAINSLFTKIDAEITNITQLADTVFRVSFFTLLPYRLNLYGNQLSLPNLSEEIISDFHNDFVTPSNTTILISGNFDKDGIIRTIKTALKDFKTKEKSKYFKSQAANYKFNSNAPLFVVNLPQKVYESNRFTRVFSSPNSDSIVVCGIPAPEINSTNFPLYITKVVRAALLNKMDVLSAEWTDLHKNRIIDSFNVVDFQGWNTGWIYAYIVLPNEYASEGSLKLRNLFASVFSGLADGKLINAANSRAVFENDFSGNKELLNNIIISDLFNLHEVFGSSLKYEIYSYSPNSFRQFLNQYGKYPVSTIVTSQK